MNERGTDLDMNTLLKKQVTIASLLLIFVLFGVSASAADYKETKDYFVCREQLTAIANQWLDGDAPIAENARQTTNGEETMIIYPLAGMYDRTFYCDEQKGLVSVWARIGPELYQARLAVRCGQITEIEAFEVAGELFGNPVPVEGGIIPRQELIATANIYYDALILGTAPPIFSEDILKYENGNLVCSDPISCGQMHEFFGFLVSDVRDRRWVVDPDYGEIVAYTVFDVNNSSGKLVATLTSAERFHVVYGLVVDMNALWVADPEFVEFVFSALGPSGELPDPIEFLQQLDEITAEQTFEIIDPLWQPGKIIKAHHCRKSKECCHNEND